MNNWSIRQRINLSFAVILILIIAMGAVSFVELQGVGRENVSLEKDSLPGLEYAGELRAAWIMNYSLTGQHVILEDKDALQRVSIGLAANEAQIDELTSKYETALTTPQERALHEKLKAARVAYLDAQKHLLEEEASHGRAEHAETNVHESSIRNNSRLARVAAT